MKKMKKISLIMFLYLIAHSGAIKAQEFTIKIDNEDRTYIVRLPRDYKFSNNLPIHLFFHGGGQTKERAEEIYGFTQHADTSGYILVYPQGLYNYWSRENDLMFISTLIDTLNNKYKVDKQRVYVSGHSSGSVLVHILACELSNKVTAFGDIGGYMQYRYKKYYKPIQPVPFIKIHSTNDNIIPYGGTKEYFSVDSMLSFWKYNNKCLLQKDSVNLPNIVKSDSSNVIRYTYGQNNSEIVFYQVINGGHDAPGWKLINSMGFTNRDINTPQVLWDFFKKHKLTETNDTNN